MGVPVPLFSFLLEHTLQHPCRGLIRAFEKVAVYVGRGAGPCVSGAPRDRDERYAGGDLHRDIGMPQ